MVERTDQQLTPAGRLRSDILAGIYSPGDRLIEVALAEHYAVGRGAVRAALVELKAEGLVDIEPNRGAVVRRVTVDEAIEIAEARKVLEGLLAGRAASSGDRAAHGSLAGIVDEMRAAVSGGDTARYSELNQALHSQIWEMSGHHVAIDLAANLRDRSAHHQFRLAVMPGRARESLEQHAAIVDAIGSGDAREAETAMHEHLDSVIDVLRHWSEMGVTV